MSTSLSIQEQPASEGSGYVVSFEEGEAILQPGETEDQLDIIWFGIEPLYQGLGIGERVIGQLKSHFPHLKLNPWGVLPEAQPFWEKMAARGYVQPSTH